MPRIAKTSPSKYIAGLRDIETKTRCAPIGKGRAVRICLTRTGKPGRAIRSSADACAALREMTDLDRESFVALYLDAKLRVVGIEEIAKGHATGVEVHPREVFKGAVLANASSILVAHNHPSGDAEFSSDDLTLTDRLVKAGKILGVPVVDHVLVTTNGCASAREKDPAQFEGYGRRR